ncbi:MAG: hypothetical protein IIC15_07125 [Thaumarchaeota archaeon]|nr:hypothetical protein [Nitrososphaerota archaeon]
MKRITTIALFAGMFAVTVGILGFSGNSATANMISALPQSQDNVGMLGHVEYKVLDEFGNIKQYMQNDNIVVQVGKDCVARAVFDTDVDPGACPTNAEFQYIAIGNKTGGTIDDTQVTLEGNACATASVDGEMARKLVTPTFTASGSGTGTIVTLDLSSNPFTFGASNATAVIDSGIFNANTSPDGEGQCSALGTTEMFAIQQLNVGTGISVSDGDSLSVKWTITVG